MSAAKVHDIFARASKHSAKKKMSPLVSVAVAVVSFHMKCGPEDQDGRGCGRMGSRGEILLCLLAGFSSDF